MESDDNGLVEEATTTSDHEDLGQPTARLSHPNSSLFVRSLPPDATTESLTNFFSQFYPIKHAVVILDKESGRSKSFGFVTFADATDAQLAKEEFQESLFQGQRLQIDFAKPRQRKTQGDGHSQPDSGQVVGQAPLTRSTNGRLTKEYSKLIIRNLPWSVKKPEQLARLFMSYGKVKYATLPKCKPGLSPGFGFVVLRGKQNAEKALLGVNGKLIEGRSLAVDWAVEKSEWQKVQDHQEVTLDIPECPEQLSADGSFEPDDLSDARSHDSQPFKISETSSNNSHGADKRDTQNRESSTEATPDVESNIAEDVSSTLFVRNLPYDVTDEVLTHHFTSFGPVRYACVVVNQATSRSRGTGFVCFYDEKDAKACLLQAPRTPDLSQGKIGKRHATSANASILQDSALDPFGLFTIRDRVLQVSQAVGKHEAHRLRTQRSVIAASQDQDRRHLYLLSEGIVPPSSSLHSTLSPSDVRMREQNATRRQRLVKDNPSLYLSLSRLSIRNIPRSMTAKDLKALARQAVVGFAKDVKEGRRQPLSKEEVYRDRQQMKEAEKARRLKARGIIKQAKVIYESQDGAHTSSSGSGTRSHGYGFIEYTSHRWALMGLRWLNGHRVERSVNSGSAYEVDANSKAKTLVAEFAIENARVVARRTEEKQVANKTRTPTWTNKAHTHLGSRTQEAEQGKPLRASPKQLPVSASRSKSKGSNDLKRKEGPKWQQIIGRKRASRKGKRSTVH